MGNGRMREAKRDSRRLSSIGRVSEHRRGQDPCLLATRARWRRLQSAIARRRRGARTAPMRQISSALVSAFALLAALHAQDNVRLVVVPDNLRLPATAGANLLLEVEVSGAPDAIWLASDAAAQDRLPLQDVGQRRFQANLADARLFDLLPAGRDQGSLFVFARFGTRTAQSPAIAWARDAKDDGKVRSIVRCRGKPARIALPDERLWVDPSSLERIELQGASARQAAAKVRLAHGALPLVRRAAEPVRWRGKPARIALPDERLWVAPSSLERIELQGASARQAAAKVRLADVELPLVRRADEQVWVLDVDARMRERLMAVDAFEIELRLGPASTLFEFRCVPPRLDLEDPVTTFVVPQRKKRFVPGSRN